MVLDWSIDSQLRGTRSLSINERVIPAGSAEEARWLSVEGRDLDALRLFRRERPDVSVADARAARARLKKA